MTTQKQLYELGVEYGTDNNHLVLDTLLSCAYSQCCDALDQPEPMTWDNYYQLFGAFMGGVIAGWSDGRFERFDSAAAARSDATPDEEAGR